MNSINYIRCSKGEQLPAYAIQGGCDDQGRHYYHVKAVVDGKTIPGKVRLSSNHRLTNAWIPWGGKEHDRDNFEVLTTEWRTSHVESWKGDKPPKNAIEGGYNSGPTYHAKGKADGLEFPGKVEMKSEKNETVLGSAYIPYHKEHRVDKFQVLVIDDEISAVNFDIDDAKMLSTTPRVLGKQENRNDTSVEQSMEFSFNETITETSTFAHETGVSIAVGTEFNTGIPFVAGGKVSVAVTASESVTYGTSNSLSQRFTASFPVTAAPRTIVVCEAVVHQTELEIPYTITLRSGKKASGIWKGVSAWGLRSSTKEIKQ